MRKKYIITGITCTILLLAGICYSLAYRGDTSRAVMISELSPQPENGGITGVPSEDKSSGRDASKVTEAGEDPALTREADKALDSTGEEAADIYVHLCGAVLYPGVYRVPEQSRVVDVIEHAGGLSEDAAGDYINQAEQVTDGQRVYIPNREEVKDIKPEEYYSGNNSAAKHSAAKSTEASRQLVNINTADKAELMELPGIGETKAASIIEYRKTSGAFQKIEDLMKIPGIKEGLFHKVSAYITVG